LVVPALGLPPLVPAEPPAFLPALLPPLPLPPLVAPLLLPPVDEPLLPALPAMPSKSAPSSSPQAVATPKPVNVTVSTRKSFRRID
jgi:hypothetical protein